MAQKLGVRGSHADGDGPPSGRSDAHQIPGLREHLEDDLAARIRRGDVRLTFELDPDADAEEIQRLNKFSAVIQGFERNFAQLRSGATVLIPRWILGGNSSFGAEIPWFADRFSGVILAELHAGDWVTPIYGDHDDIAEIAEDLGYPGLTF